MCERTAIPTRRGYDLWSDIYDADGNPLIAVEEPVFRELVGDVRGKRIIDVGCGTGRQSHQLARIGAHVTAVDFSQGMLSRARAKPGSESIRWVEHDITARLPFPDQSFDVVTCALVLDHIHELDAFFAELARLAARGGAIVCTVMHPAMMLKGVQARFTDPATGEKVLVDSATNQISDYISAILRCGLAIDHISEHTVTPDVAARFPRGEPYLNWPVLLALKLTPRDEPALPPLPSHPSDRDSSARGRT